MMLCAIHIMAKLSQQQTGDIGLINQALNSADRIHAPPADY